ncbi:cytochrome-c peroxidase [Kolteria novifilia]
MRSKTVAGMAVVAGAFLLVLSVANGQGTSGQSQAAPGAFQLEAPKGLDPVPVPDDNVMTHPKVELGKRLFFDPRLSLDNSTSCASCHDPKTGWSDGQPVSDGVKGKTGTRNAPTVMNAAYNYFQFWDGRSPSLEDQAMHPILNPVEMAMPSMDEVVAKLKKVPGYQEEFGKVFPDGITATNLQKAIAAFERTILSGNAPYDHFEAGDKSALSAAALRGKDLFFGKANCAACHSGPSFTDGGFHNTGVGMDRDNPDVGRETVTHLLGDRGSFKTPTLRDIARTAPYMHDGSLATLEDVINLYDKGGIINDQLDEEMFPLNLTAEEKKDLITFLKEGLASDNYPYVEVPTLPQ